MKKSTIILVLFGLLLESIGILVAFPKRFPSVLDLVASDYRRASQGVQRLVNRQDLKPGNPGFDEIGESTVYGTNGTVMPKSLPRDDL